MTAPTAYDRLATLAALVNGDPALVRRGRFLTTTFLPGVDEVEYLVTVAEGRVLRVERGPFLMRAWSFAVRAPADAWQRFWEPVPAPGYHDLEYHGLLAPRAAWRSAVVPTPAAPRAPAGGPAPRRWPWARLLRRVFGFCGAGV